MKGKQQDISTIINNGEASLKCILLYGPNSYLINELYNKLCDSLLDKNDVFAPSEFNIKEISKNADAFYNEAESLAFGGGRKYLKIDMDNSESAGPVLDLLKDDIKETTLLIKGDVLSPRSNIRKSLEKLENTLIVPFYDSIIPIKLIGSVNSWLLITPLRSLNKFSPSFTYSKSLIKSCLDHLWIISFIFWSRL